MSATRAATPPPRPRPVAAFQQRPPRFFDGLKWSIGAHAAVIFLVVLKSLVFPSRPQAIIPSLRVDLVGLPDLLKKDLSKVQKTPTGAEINDILKKVETESRKLREAKAAEEAKPDEMVLKPKKSDGDTVAEENRRRLQRMKALSRIQESLEERPNKPAVTVKGNILSKGTSLSGDAKETAEATYFDLIRDALQENWELPPWLARQSFSAQVKIFVDARGKIRDFAFLKVSGNRQFDDEVRRTLQKSQPLPTPPRELLTVTLRDGITVGFPL